MLPLYIHKNLKIYEYIGHYCLIMNRVNSRVQPAILRILGAAGGPLGAASLARELAMDGFTLQPRMVRNYLAGLDEKGWTENLGRAGRRLTSAGQEELQRIGLSERLNLAAARLDDLAFRMELDPARKQGDIILNLSRVAADHHRALCDVIRELARTPFGIPSRVALGLEGEPLCGQMAPYGQVLLGTVCNVTLTGVLRAEGIPVASRFAGLVEIANGAPDRFTHMIHYDGCTMDPALLFIKSRMTRVIPAVRGGSGAILAGFREIPAVARPRAEHLTGLLERMGLGHALVIGQPGRPVLGVPVAPGRVGLAIAAGLNIVAALEESGISTEHHAMSGLFPAEALLRPIELERRLLTTRRLHQRIAALMDNPPPDREYAQTE